MYRLIFMIHEAKKQVVELPDRKEISLCEAVTAVIDGKALNVEEIPPPLHGLAEQTGPPLHGLAEQTGKRMTSRALKRQLTGMPANERLTKAAHLLEALRQAAYAGRLKFRAIKGYANPADGLNDIDPAFDDKVGLVIELAPG